MSSLPSAELPQATDRPELPQTTSRSGWPQATSRECTPGDPTSDSWARVLTASALKQLHAGAYPDLLARLSALLESSHTRTARAQDQASQGKAGQGQAGQGQTSGGPEHRVGQSTPADQARWSVVLTEYDEQHIVWSVSHPLAEPDSPKTRVRLPAGSALIGLAGENPTLVGRLGSSPEVSSENEHTALEQPAICVGGELGDVVEIPLGSENLGYKEPTSAASSTLILRPSNDETILQIAAAGELLIVWSAQQTRHTIRVLKKSQLSRAEGSTAWEVVQTLQTALGSFGAVTRRAGTLQTSVSTFGVQPERVELWPRADHASAALDVLQNQMDSYAVPTADGQEVVVQVTSGDTGDPLVVYCYGGFGKSTLPAYSATMQSAWLDYGGRYAIVHVRGGGDCGQGWHAAGRRSGKSLARQDLVQALTYLFEHGLATPGKTALHGMSNGAIHVVGALTTCRYPLGCAAIQVPIADLQNFYRFPPGLSWLDEYGDPRIAADAKVIDGFDPLRLARQRVDTPVLISGFTHDDVTAVQHARALAQTMIKAGTPVCYQETTTGSHTGAVSLHDRVVRAAELWAFFHHHLM